MKIALIIVCTLAIISSVAAVSAVSYRKGYNKAVFETKCQLDGGFIENGFCYVYGA